MDEDQCPTCGDYIDDYGHCSCCWVCTPGSVTPTWNTMCGPHFMDASIHYGELHGGYEECGNCLYCNNLDFSQTHD
ncbi:hypothetical protein [Glycomyces dulcitolivorans]|uniref:hypothetical protein n=1 Tax=Glycomyces dulcitolivorans TaxID=2200759 RepID=UPI0013008735|nr:hypothetical protein [Glycomyces dulcitolivorans]